MATEIPKIGDLVDYGLDGFGKGPGKYRVTSWLCEAVFQSSGDELVDEVLREVLAEEGARPRMRYCLPEEATHVSLAGVCGAVAPIAEVLVTGTVDWPAEHIESARETALRRGLSKTLLF